MSTTMFTSTPTSTPTAPSDPRPDLADQTSASTASSDTSTDLADRTGPATACASTAAATINTSEAPICVSCRKPVVSQCSRCGQHSTLQMLATRDVNIERTHTASFAAVLNRLALLEAANSALQDRITTLEGISTSSSAPLSELAQQHHHQPPSPPLQHPVTPLPEFRPSPVLVGFLYRNPSEPANWTDKFVSMMDIVWLNPKKLF